MSLARPALVGDPGEGSHRYFRNVLLGLKKAIQTSTDREKLRLEMEKFLNANRKVSWPHATSGVFRKDEVEKAVEKVITEFGRYLHDFSNRQDLLDALNLVHALIDRLSSL